MPILATKALASARAYGLGAQTQPASLTVDYTV